MRLRATIVTLALSVPAGAVTRQHLGPPVPAEVRRVVTLAPSLSEIVLALGAGDRLVGVTRFDDDPRVAGLPRVGGYNDPEPETVLGLHPDLVLAQPAPENRGPVETLARLGIPVEAFALGDLREIGDAMEQIGALLGLPERGRGRRRPAVRAPVRRGRGARAAQRGRDLRLRPAARPPSHPRSRAGAGRDAPLDRAAAPGSPPRRGTRRPGRRASREAGAVKRSAAVRAVIALLALAPLVVIAAGVGLSLGAGKLSLTDALRGVEPDATVLFRLRVPRVVLAAIVGEI